MDITGLGSAFDFAKDLVNHFLPAKASEKQKLEAASKMSVMLEQRESKLLEAKKDIIVAELQQGDLYTKRARPSIVYVGLIVIVFVHVLYPVLFNLAMLVFILLNKLDALTPEMLKHINALGQIDLPAAFWATWGSVCGIYGIGRSAEKWGSSNKLVQFITGNKFK